MGRTPLVRKVGETAVIKQSITCDHCFRIGQEIVLESLEEKLNCYSAVAKTPTGGESDGPWFVGEEDLA